MPLKLDHDGIIKFNAQQMGIMLDALAKEPFYKVNDLIGSIIAQYQKGNSSEEITLGDLVAAAERVQPSSE